MKSRSSVSVAALLSACVIGLTGCEEPKVDAAIFDSVQQCINEPGMLRDECEKRHAEAKSQHAAVAPKYASAKECQAEFGAGQCEQAPYRSQSGGSIFMPLMMGYMMGSMIGGRGGTAIWQRSTALSDSKRTQYLPNCR